MLFPYLRSTSSYFPHFLPTLKNRFAIAWVLFQEEPNKNNYHFEHISKRQDGRVIFIGHFNYSDCSVSSLGFV